jgi:sialic acid synthase SpsE
MSFIVTVRRDQMKFCNTDLRRKVLVIAEIGNNHEGSLALAEELVGKAAEAGASAVKFQTFLTERYVSPASAERFARLRRFQLSFAHFEKLSRQARHAGLLFLSTPFDLESARFLAGIVDAIKIGSADNTFYALIEEAAISGKPAILSTGLADLTQIRAAETVIRHTWRDRGIPQDLALLHCVSSYPVPPPEANLLAIRTLQSEFDCVVGYSDHTVGIEAAVLAVAVGARIIEKHFTIDNNYSDFRDHKLSADPPTFARMVERIAMAAEMLGDGAIGMAECEKSEAALIRRSIAAARDLPAGTVISADDIMWVRPGTGLPPGRERDVVGCRLRTAMSAGDLFGPELLQGVSRAGAESP